MKKLLIATLLCTVGVYAEDSHGNVNSPNIEKHCTAHKQHKEEHKKVKKEKKARKKAHHKARKEANKAHRQKLRDAKKKRKEEKRKAKKHNAYAAGVSQTQPIYLAKVQRDSQGNRVDHSA